MEEVIESVWGPPACFGFGLLQPHVVGVEPWLVVSSAGGVFLASGASVCLQMLLVSSVLQVVALVLSGHIPYTVGSLFCKARRVGVCLDVQYCEKVLGTCGVACRRVTISVAFHLSV